MKKGRCAVRGFTTGQRLLDLMAIEQVLRLDEDYLERPAPELAASLYATNQKDPIGAIVHYLQHREKYCRLPEPQPSDEQRAAIEEVNKRLRNEERLRERLSQLTNEREQIRQEFLAAHQKEVNECRRSLESLGQLREKHSAELQRLGALLAEERAERSDLQRRLIDLHAIVGQLRRELNWQYTHRARYPETAPSLVEKLPPDGEPGDAEGAEGAEGSQCAICCARTKHPYCCVPCGHAHFCYPCLRQVRNCPHCRAPITHRQLIYG